MKWLLQLLSTAIFTFYLLCTHQHSQFEGSKCPIKKNIRQTNKIQFPILLSIYSFVCFACVRTRVQMHVLFGLSAVVFMTF